MIFTKADVSGLINYKYRGGDSSPIYIFILSPLAQSIVELSPRWIAPNILTLSGLLFSIVACFLTIFMNSTLDDSGCYWLHLLSALSLFSYQTMDNMDGKQVASSVWANYEHNIYNRLVELVHPRL